VYFVAVSAGCLEHWSCPAIEHAHVCGFTVAARLPSTHAHSYRTSRCQFVTLEISLNTKIQARLSVLVTLPYEELLKSSKRRNLARTNLIRLLNRDSQTVDKVMGKKYGCLPDGLSYTAPVRHQLQFGQILAASSQHGCTKSSYAPKANEHLHCCTTLSKPH
jgi:hypothetical protein